MFLHAKWDCSFNLMSGTVLLMSSTVLFLGGTKKQTYAYKNINISNLYYGNPSGKYKNGKNFYFFLKINGEGKWVIYFST